MFFVGSGFTVTNMILVYFLNDQRMIRDDPNISGPYNYATKMEVDESERASAHDLPLDF